MRFAPRRVDVPLPTSHNIAIDYSIELQRALHEQLSRQEWVSHDGDPATRPRLQTSITDVRVEGALAGASGVCYATDTIMTVDGSYVVQGKPVWRGTVTGRVRHYKPARQQWYAYTHARASQELCYDVAHKLVKALREHHESIKST